MWMDRSCLMAEPHLVQETPVHPWTDPPDHQGVVQGVMAGPSKASEVLTVSDGLPNSTRGV
jgi:hypothetical protein